MYCDQTGKPIERKNLSTGVFGKLLNNPLLAIENNNGYAKQWYGRSNLISQELNYI
jgi:hypothetical protein